MESVLLVLSIFLLGCSFSHQSSLPSTSSDVHDEVIFATVVPEEVGRPLQERKVIDPETIFLHQALGREKRESTQRYPNNDAVNTRPHPSAGSSRMFKATNRDVSNGAQHKIATSMETSPRVNVDAESKQFASSAAIKSSEQKQSLVSTFTETSNSRSQPISNKVSKNNRNTGSTTHPASAKARDSIQYSQTPTHHRQNTRSDDIKIEHSNEGVNLMNVQSLWNGNGIDISKELRQRSFVEGSSADFDLSETQKRKRAEGEHLTRPKDQSDLGIATSMLKSGVDEIVSASKPIDVGPRKTSSEDLQPFVEPKPFDSELKSTAFDSKTIDYASPVKYYYQLGSANKPVDVDSVMKHYQSTSNLKSADTNPPGQHYHSPTPINYDPSMQHYQHLSAPPMSPYQQYYNQFQYPETYNAQSSKSGWYYGPNYDTMVPVPAKPFRPEFLYEHPESEVFVSKEAKESKQLGRHDSSFEVMKDRNWSKESMPLGRHDSNCEVIKDREWTKESLLETEKCEKEPVLVAYAVPKQIEERRPRKKGGRKSTKRPKCPRKMLKKKLRGKEAHQDSGSNEGPRKKPKVRGFLRFLDALGRRSDNIADSVLNRPWDKLYRNHKNCWKYDEPMQSRR